MPDYIGPATPAQVVKIRLGRFTRYWQENPGNTGPHTSPSGAGYQPWNNKQYPCASRVGTPGSNPEYFRPWQALWLPETEYIVVPNVLEVRQEKKQQIGGIGTTNIDIENVMYPDAGGYHIRERGYLSPLRGKFASGDPGLPDIPRLLDEIEKVVETNEWEGRFAYAAQVTIYQGYGTAVTKTFTGLIEEVDSTSHPDKLTLTARDFGQIFTDTHFIGWGKDPIIKTPVTFVDILEASKHRDVGYNAHASSEDPAHLAAEVLDFDESTYWLTPAISEANHTEYVEIALNEGRYHFADIAMQFGGMEVYLSLRPAVTKKGDAPSREGVPMTIENKWLDKNGWVDLTRKEEDIVPGVNGGVSYTRKYESYPSGKQRTPFDEGESDYIVGDNSVLRLSFQKMHATGGAYKAGVKEFHGLWEALEEGGAKAEWVTTEDIADVVRTICQWAGFKEWDIEDTGARLPVRLVANPSESYIDVIKSLAESIGFTFFLADPSPDGSSFAGGSIEALGGSLGVPTFRKSKVTANDATEIPIITDRSLLTAIEVKQSNEPLPYIIKVYGRTLSRIGDMEAAILGGKRLVYVFRPPWAGLPPYYDNTRVGGIIKTDIHNDFLLATGEMVRNAAWFIALQQALESIQATIEFPAFPGLDLDDHALLMDLGTGISTRIAVMSRQSTFTDGEKRKFTMQVTGALIDTPDVRDMLKIIAGDATATGSFKEYGNPKAGTPSSLGFG